MAHTRDDGIIEFSEKEYRQLASSDCSTLEIDGKSLTFDLYDRIMASENWYLSDDKYLVRPTKFISVDGMTWDNATEFFTSHEVTDELWDEVCKAMNPEFLPEEEPEDNSERARGTYLCRYLERADDDLCVEM